MVRLRNFVKLSIVILLLFPGAGISSSQGGEKPTTITSKTDLVQIPVVVLDGSGKHMAGLTKDDFEILENGKSKPVAMFEEINTTPNRMERTPSRNGVFTNAVTGDKSAKRLTIFALDTINTPFLDQNYAREELIKFLARRINSDEPCALISIQGNGVKVIHDFSSDPAVLVEALKKVTDKLPGPNSPGLSGAEIEHNSAMSAVQPQTAAQIVTKNPQADSPSLIREMETQEAAIENFVSGAELGFAVLAQRNAIQTTLQAFQHIAEAFAGVPGRKSLIWATASFPFGLDPTTGALVAPRVFQQGAAVSVNTMSATGALPELPSSTRLEANEDLKVLAPIYERTIQMLNDANIALYPVDARGLVTFFPDATTQRIAGLQSFNSALFEASRETMEGFADMTGGKAFYNRNDLDAAFGKAADDSNRYYMVAYYLDKNSKPGWHKLQVKVKKNGGHVRARHGFFVTAANREADTRRMDVKSALASPLDYTALSISVRWLGTQAVGSKKKANFEIILPPSAGVVDESNNNHLSLDVVALARNAKGDPLGQFAEHLDANLKPETLPTLHKDGVNYANSIQIEPGEFNVRFVVRDDLTGRLGSVSAPLHVAP
jgi:VWFA-related protein